MEEMNENQVMSLTEYQGQGKVRKEVFTTLTDSREIFNLEGGCDYKLNECEGKEIYVRDILCKVYEKPLDNPIYEEETGKLKKDKEYKRITILIDNEGKSYVTASNFFFFKFMEYCRMFPHDIEEGKCIIRIKKMEVRNSSNKSLGFELV